MRQPTSSNPNRASEPGRFCPDCRLIFDLEEMLCPECGTETAPLSYCDVCEHYWVLAEGMPCPKHDVLLIASPVPSSKGGGGGGEEDLERIDWVTVKTFAALSQANAPRIRLEAEGIPTFLDGEHMGSNFIYNNATGGVKLQVPRDLFAQARILLSQTWSLPDDEAADDETDDAWEELAPEPGRNRRSIMRGTIIFILLLPFIRMLIALLLRR